MHGRMVHLQTTSGERKFIEQIKAPIFLEAVLTVEIMYEPQSNLEEKVNPSIHFHINSNSVIRPVK